MLKIKNRGNPTVFFRPSVLYLCGTGDHLCLKSVWLLEYCGIPACLRGLSFLSLFEALFSESPPNCEYFPRLCPSSSFSIPWESKETAGPEADAGASPPALPALPRISCENWNKLHPQVFQFLLHFPLESLFYHSNLECYQPHH